MTIRHFQIFKAVCDSGGITAAAERLNITQPSVSIAIREMESFYNTKLFDRINRRIYLTDSGALLRQYVDNVLKQYDEAAEMLREGRVTSRCRLGVNLSFAESHLSALITEIKTEVPGCVIHVSAFNNELLEDMLINNRIDFAICDEIYERQSMAVEHLYRETIAPYCSPELYAEDEIEIEKLSGLPLLLREKGSGLRSCVDRTFTSRGLSEQIFIESSSTMSLISLARNAFGVVFLPLTLGDKFCVEGGLHRVDMADAEISRLYYLAYNEKKHLVPSMKAIKNTVVKMGWIDRIY